MLESIPPVSDYAQRRPSLLLSLHPTYIIKRCPITTHIKQKDPIEKNSIYQSPLHNLRCFCPCWSSVLELHAPSICLLEVKLVLRMEILEVWRPFLTRSVWVVDDVERCGNKV